MACSTKFFYLRTSSHYMVVNLRSFRLKVRHRRKKYLRFLTRLKKKNPRGLDALAEKINREVWKETDCTACANCCITMSPTYSQKDIRRISFFLGMPMKAFKSKWLYRDKEGDWLNRSTPCPFLDTRTHHCRIYEVRPDDCRGFPHLTKKKMVDYMHVHTQNLDHCPATFRMVEMMMMHFQHKN